MDPVKSSLSVAERVDAACDRFEQEWRAGRRPRIDDFVAAAPESDRTSLRRQLLGLELELQGKGEAETSVTRSSVNSANGSDRTVQRVTPEMPARVGRFEVRAILGDGAFGRVYRAFDPQLNREVAVKVPLDTALQSTAEREQFLKEARTVATINHPNVCQIHEVGEQDGRPYLVMALVPGQTLAATLKARKGLLPAKQTAAIVRKIASALASAHAKGVIHRDLKPANVMFDRERRDVIVMDFGLARGPVLGDARGTQSGVIKGTPAYMSPEQARGDSKAVGPAADVYSLGVILYELLTGRRPFTGTATEVIGKILHVEPEKPSMHNSDIDPRLEAACLKAMMKDVEARFASMRELVAAMDAILKAPAGPAAETAQANVTRRDDEASAHASTKSDQLGEVFAAMSMERKATAAAVERAIERTRTPRWVYAAIGLAVVIGFAVLGGILFLTRSDKVSVNLSVVLKDVDLADKTLSFFLDDEPIAAEDLAKNVELSPGEHIFMVKRGAVVVKRVKFTVTGGQSPGITVEELPPPPPETPPQTGPELKPSPLDGLKQEDIPDRLMAAAFGDRQKAPKELVAIYDSITLDRKDLNENYFGGFALDKIGGTLASSRYPYTIVELHNLATGRKYNTIATEPGSWIGWIRIAPDSQSIYYQRRSDKLVGAGIGGKVRWEQPVRAENYSTPALSPDGTTLVAADKDPKENALHVFDAETGAIRATWRDLIDKPICRLAFSPDGQTLAVQSGGKFTFVSAKDGTKLPLPAVERTSGEPTFSLDGKGIYSSFDWKQPEDFCVEFDIATGKRTEYRHPPHGCRGILPNPVFPIFATFDNNAQLHFWDAKLGPDQQPYVIPTGAKVERMLFTPEGRYLVVGAHNLIMIFRLPVERRVSEWAKVENKVKGDDGFVPLFNGKDLAGWKTHADQPGDWRVTDGVLTATEAVSHLYTERNDYTDFHLRFDVRATGGNTGVMYRSPFGPTLGERKEWVTGYNAKFDVTRMGGIIVDKDGVLHRDREVNVKAGEWAKFELIVQGDRHIVKLNGETTADYTDPDPRYRSGHIVLQQHSGKAAVEFRNIEVKDLRPK